MDGNKSDLPKGVFPKPVATEKNSSITIPKTDIKGTPLLKKADSGSKQVEELSAKEQESRRKFREKFNKLKKMPMPPQPTINVNSEGLTEGELTVENVKRKFKQIFSKIFKESLPSAMPESEKTIEKKQANAIKICVGTKPVDSAIYRFACMLPLKRKVYSASKKIESMLCKSVGLIPAQCDNNNQFMLISKDKQDKPSSENAMNGNGDQIVLSSKEDPKLEVIKNEQKIFKINNKITVDSTSPAKTPPPSVTADPSAPVVSIESTAKTMLITAPTPTAAAATATPSPPTAVTTPITPMPTITLTSTSTPTLLPMTTPTSTPMTTPTSTPMTMTTPTLTAMTTAATTATPTPTPTSTPATTSTLTAMKTAAAAITAAAASAATTTPTIPFPEESDYRSLQGKKGITTKPTIDLAPDEKLKTGSNVQLKKIEPEKKVELVAKSTFSETIKSPLKKQHPKIVEPIRPSPFANLLKAFNLDKLFKPSTWFSKSKVPKTKMIPFSIINKIPIRLRQGFVILGTFIPLYYTYHKIVTDDQLTMKLAEEN